MGMGETLEMEITCRQTQLLLPAPNPGMVKFQLKLDSFSISTMIHFVSGQNQFSYHQVLTDKSQSALCRLCQESNVIAWHILKECQAME